MTLYEWAVVRRHPEKQSLTVKMLEKPDQYQYFIEDNLYWPYKEQ